MALSSLGDHGSSSLGYEITSYYRVRQEMISRLARDNDLSYQIQSNLFGEINMVVKKSINFLYESKIQGCVHTSYASWQLASVFQNDIKASTKSCILQTGATFRFKVSK